jgi:ubiquinone/menaquinone biosynthesis C-methylase UbiE
MTSKVVEREQKFHDERFADDTLRQSKVGRFYKIAASIQKEYQEKLKHFSADGKVLEYGCGKGGAAFFLAERAADIIAIDISTVAIKEATNLALKRGLSNVKFLQMNAEHLDLDEKFNLICGSGILHHLNLTNALHEIKRVLQPGGHAVFIEPLGHNPFINLYRRFTPKIRSQDEHPLLVKDLETIKNLSKPARRTTWRKPVGESAPRWKRGTPCT